MWKGGGWRNTVTRVSQTCKWSLFIFYLILIYSNYTTLQMKDRWESNINVGFQFMYSQKWNCDVSLFPKQIVLSPSFHIHGSLSDLYIPRICLPILLQPNRYRMIQIQIHECRNWEWCRTVLYLGTNKSDFRYSAP
jgi:hypothetical protein